MKINFNTIGQVDLRGPGAAPTSLDDTPPKSPQATQVARAGGEGDQPAVQPESARTSDWIGRRTYQLRPPEFQVRPPFAPIPCPVCGCPGTWLSTGRQWNCGFCLPYPSRAMVAAIWVIRLNSAGSEWRDITGLAPGFAQNERNQVLQTNEPYQGVCGPRTVDLEPQYSGFDGLTSINADRSAMAPTSRGLSLDDWWDSRPGTGAIYVQ